MTHIMTYHLTPLSMTFAGLCLCCHFFPTYVISSLSNTSLFPCLSLLLSSYPLTHILVITSGVPCRNSIAPPPPSSSDIKLSPCPCCSLIQAEGDGKVSLPLLCCMEVLLLPLDAIWSQLAVNLIPVNRSCGPCALMPPEVLMQVYFTGSRWAVVELYHSCVWEPKHLAYFPSVAENFWNVLLCGIGNWHMLLMSMKLHGHYCTKRRTTQHKCYSCRFHA